MPQVYRGGRPYGAGHPARITPHEVRTHEFPPRRRGVDPDQVHAFQLRVADDLTALNQELAILSHENERLKRALRDWQAPHTRSSQQAPEQHRGNTGHW